jgi:heat shock protein HslJ
MNKELSVLMTTVLAAGLLSVAGCKNGNQECPKAAAADQAVETAPVAPEETKSAEPVPETKAEAAPVPAPAPAPEAVKPAEPASVPQTETPVAVDEALSGDWVVTRLAGAKNIVTGGKGPHIDFRDASRISGNSGINTIGGEYKTGENNQLKFDRMISTRKAGPQDAMDYERIFHQTLQKVASYKISGDTLSLLDADGNELMTLKKQ